MFLCAFATAQRPPLLPPRAAALALGAPTRWPAAAASKGGSGAPADRGAVAINAPSSESRRVWNAWQHTPAGQPHNPAQRVGA